jgi:hypothetical protein
MTRRPSARILAALAALAVAAGLLAIAAVTAHAAPAASRAQYWGTAPLDARLPRPDAYCAARVQRYPERIAGNTVADRTVPPRGANLHLGPWRLQNPVMARNLAKVTGNFKGTTDEIFEWAACKWGWDQNAAKAEAVAESTWNQHEEGDGGESWCILQVKAARPAPASRDNAWGGYPWTEKSTAVCADLQMAILRSYYDGDSYMGSAVRGHFWAAVSAWESGYNSGLDGYVREVQYYWRHQSWRQLH